MVNQHHNPGTRGPLASYGVKKPFFANAHPGPYTGNKSGYAPGGVTWKPLARPKPKKFHPGDAYTGSGVNFYPYPTTKEKTHPTTPTKPPTKTKKQPGVINPPTPGPTTNPWLDALTADINRQIADAKQNALKAQRDLLIGFGSQSLAKKYLGNDPIVATISDNPNSQSTLGRLAYGYQGAQKSTNEEMNAGNLWFGGARGQALQQLGHQNLGNIFDATKLVQGELNDIDIQRTNLINALLKQLMDAQRPQEM